MGSHCQYRYRVEGLAIARTVQTIYYELVPTNSCPIDIEETAEAYCMGKLDQLARHEFESHCSNCPSCSAVVANAGRFVRSMRAAIQQLRTGSSTDPAVASLDCDNSVRIQKPFMVSRSSGSA